MNIGDKCKLRVVLESLLLDVVKGNNGEYILNRYSLEPNEYNVLKNAIEGLNEDISLELEFNNIEYRKLDINDDWEY